MSQFSRTIRVISRSSNLALKQVGEVFALFHEIAYQLISVESFGDKHKDISLLTNTVADIFTRELDNALLKNEADIAIHSAKDLPYPLPQGLEIIALFEAFDKTDSLVSRNNLTLAQLPADSKIGTSSPTRKRELLQINENFQIVSIRGTIEDRIAQVDSGYIDGLIVATCALKRLGLENRIAEVLPFETHSLQGNLAIVAKSENAELKELFAKYDIRKQYGTVHLVGFGPGNPDLLTIKAERLLRSADVIFFDDLINKDYLNNFSAEKVYVGKRKDKHSKEQHEINQLLYSAAIAGKLVVRLKGGDPMIFAHGGEEIEYLQERLVNVEVVPGISTALAAAASTKISLTHRDLASSVSFISGHSPTNVFIPESGTAVYYMGASNLKNIARQSIEKGIDSQTPVVLLYNVSQSDEQVFYTNLQELTQDENNYPTPLIAIVGDVVGLKSNKAEVLKKPNILVTGTEARKFKKLGNITHQPLVELKPLDDFGQVKDVFSNLNKYQYIVFTSKYTVQYFFEILKSFNSDVKSLSKCKIVSIGKVTTAALRKVGIAPALQPVDESSDGIIALFRELKIENNSVLIPRSNLALPILPNGLRNQGLDVTTVVVYNNSIPSHVKPLDLSQFQYIAFASPSGVDNFLKIYQIIPMGIVVIAKGNVTFEHILSKGISKERVRLEKD
jgi:uroporphyrinogen III methyltransferase/synthase